MFDRLMGSKPDHPMANMRKARELVAELADAPSLKALEQSVSWLGSISDTKEFKLDHRFDLIALIDQGTKTHQFRLAQEYVDALRLQKNYETRIWNASFGYWKALGKGYLDCLAQFQAGAAVSAAMKSNMPVIVGRILRTLTLQLKWILLRYGLIESRIWQDLGRTYAFAESQGFASQRVVIYPGLHGESSAQEEFLKALMFSTSAPDNLPPAQIHIAERTIAHFASRFVLQPKVVPGCHFFFDLSMHKPPVRISTSISMGPMVRFFGAGDAGHGLQELITAVEEKDGVPENVHLGGNFDKATTLPVLMHLKQFWAGKPPLRSNPRRDLATRITVVPSFQEILSWIDVLMDSNSLEFNDPASSESWIVFNVSDGGYGAIVPKTKGDWLQIGKLLAIHPETATTNRIGIIRRLGKDNYDQNRVGIQVLGTTALPIKLLPSVNMPDAEASAQGNAALLLSDKPDNNGEVAVLMRAGSFMQTQSLQMRVRDRNYLLTPSRLIEGGTDFDWAQFKVSKHH